MTQKEDLIAKIAAFLEKQDDFLWPVRKIMQHLAITGVAEEELYRWLKKDTRFYTQDARAMFDDSDDEFSPEERVQEELAMEELGYYGGPRVMLHSKAPSREQLFRGMAQQLRTMNDALDKAMAKATPEDPESQIKLIEAKAKSHHLEQELAKLFKESKEKN